MKSVLPALPILLWSSVAFASGGDGLFAQKLGIQIGDFLVVIIPLLLIMIPLIRRSLIKRHDEVKASIDAARTEYEACSARLASAEEQLREVNVKMDSIRDSFRELAAAERKALELQATETAGKLQREAEMRLNHAALSVRAELADEVMSRALEMVEERVRAKRPPITPDATIDRLAGDGQQRGN